MLAGTDPIALVSPDVSVPRALLEAPGGFFWWYLDLLDARGNGIVVIWSFGLPFLPGYGAAVRRGAPQRPGARPSLNVAVYRDGSPACYLLQELDGEEVEWIDDTRWRFGRSTFHREDDALAITLDCPLAGGGRLRGQVQVRGAPCRPPASALRGDDADADADTAGTGSRHGWTPLLVPAQGEADLELGDGTALRIAGRAYHDRNMSAVSLHDLGIDEWFWGRASYGDEERVIYWLRGPGGEKTLALRLAPNGAVDSLPGARLVLMPAGRARYGMPRYRHVQVDVDGARFMDLHTGALIDNGPFYLRSFLLAADGGATVGYCEGVVPSRVDLHRHRPFVRMRVERTGERNSLLVPLFTGPRGGRWGRFWRHLSGVKHV